MAKTYEKLCIREMAPGCNVEGFFLLVSANVKTSNNGSQFLAGHLCDKDAEIDFKVWDYASDIHENVGSVVKIRGAVQEYNGAQQVVVERIRMAQANDVYDIKALVPCAPIDMEAVLAEIQQVLNGLSNETYKSIALKAFDRMKNDLRRIPAAKTIHHAFVGGLLMHTYNIMQMCAAAGRVYGYDIIDMDLLLTAAFCHDMGKRKEFVLSSLGLVTDYSLQGQLLGHVTMGAMEIAEIAKECGIPADAEQLLLLQHLLLSHHGELEYGSPVTPRTIEAEILSRMDMLDARVEVYREAMATVDMGCMSDYVKAVGHPIYNHF